MASIPRRACQLHDNDSLSQPISSSLDGMHDQRQKNCEQHHTDFCFQAQCNLNFDKWPSSSKVFSGVHRQPAW